MYSEFFFGKIKIIHGFNPDRHELSFFQICETELYSNLIMTYSEPEAHISIASDSRVDFCLWILIQDGLKVQPFDKHGEGTRVLQQYGFNEDSWKSWIRRVTVPWDSRLSLSHIGNVESQVFEEVASRQSFLKFLAQNQEIDAPEVNWNSVRHQIEQDVLLSQLEREQALLDYPDLDLEKDRHTLPPLLYSGCKQLQKELKRLWSKYQQYKYSNSTIKSIMERDKMYDVELNPPFQKDYQIYLVDYPKEVEYFIPPITILMGVPQNFPYNHEKFSERIAISVQKF